VNEIKCSIIVIIIFVPKTKADPRARTDFQSLMRFSRDLDGLFRIFQHHVTGRCLSFNIKTRKYEYMLINLHMPARNKNLITAGARAAERRVF
jgi:hypothetical protein